LKGDINMLSPIRKQVVDEWFINGMNAYKAYMKVKPFVKKNSAKQLAVILFKREDVQKYIEQKRNKMDNKSKIELEYLIKELVSIVESVKEEEIERDDRNRITSKPDRASALKAIDILAKIAGAYTNKIDVTTKGESLNLRDLIDFREDDE